MKIIDEKGRLFRLINVVDLLVLFAVIVIAGGIVWKLFSPVVQDAVAQQVKMTAVMRIRGATSFLVNEVNANPLTGKKLVAGNNYTDAIITKVEIVPYIQQVTTADGRIIDALDRSKKDILVTVEANVPKDTPAPTVANQEVRAGRTFTLKTQDFESAPTIESVRFK
ncbi:MAG: DUF4330 domain-containing protein [Clostridiales bacterium]|nr:DUF4330 domain-containing protein [Clostridiales bacterium]